MNGSSTEVPSDFALSNITAKISLHYSASDPSTAEKDIALLKSKVPSIFHTQIVPDFNHVQFAFGNKTYSLVYPDILSAWNENIENVEDTPDSD